MPTTVMREAPARAMRYGRIIRPSPATPSPEDQAMAQRIDLREALRVRPGTSSPAGASGPRRDPRLGQGGRGSRARDAAGPAGRPPGPLLGGGETLDPRGPAGHRRGRQGRHDQQGHGGVQPAGLSRDELQGPVHRGTGPRLPLARPPEGAAQGRDRHLQSVALRGRAGRARPRPRAERGVVGALRPDQRLRADPGRQRDHDRQVLPLDRQGRAARAVPGSLRRPDEALEVLDGRSRGAEALGRLPGGVRRRPFEDVDQPCARGTSSPRTGSGSGTWPWRRSSPTRWPSSKPAYPPVADDVPADLVIE